MGLDMYLYATKYLSPFSNEESGDRYVGVLSAMGFKEVPVKCHAASVEVKIPVAYWRKANAVHDWFVRVCQEGKDECQESYVSRDQLVQLREACKAAKLDGGKSLPPKDGFFFGSTQIDDYYYQDLDDTIKNITAILENPQLLDWDFAYRASW